MTNVGSQRAEAGNPVSDKEREFLAGLEKLTRETGIAICGCGCCGSPSLFALEGVPGDKAGYGFGHAGSVTWIDQNNDAYDREEFGHTIVRAREAFD